MTHFLEWLENRDAPMDFIMKTAVAYVFFVSIHPCDAGNGRIARATADMILAWAEATGRRFYGMSARLRMKPNACYETLEAMRTGDLDITPRFAWFFQILGSAIGDAETARDAVHRKGRFWRALDADPVNPRQRRMRVRLLDGFQGKSTPSKWAQIATCSHDPALRDIDDLITRGLFARGEAGGRSTGYRHVEPQL